MALALVDEDQDLRLDLPLRRMNYEALLIQLGRCDDQAARETFAAKLEMQLAKVLEKMLDWDLREPSAPQVKFAMAISKDLGIPLPGEALRYRGATTEFLNRWSAIFRASQWNSGKSTPHPE